MFQFGAFAPPINRGSKGLSHSEIHGSTLFCSSPWLIAALHVLHRLCMPRHPPCALYNFMYTRRSRPKRSRPRRPPIPAYTHLLRLLRARDPNRLRIKKPRPARITQRCSVVFYYFVIYLTMSKIPTSQHPGNRTQAQATLRAAAPAYGRRKKKKKWKDKIRLVYVLYCRSKIEQ